MTSIHLYLWAREGYSTFVDGGSGHVVETQGRVHVVDILQKSEEILHLFKRDALQETERRRNGSVDW